MKKNNKKWLFLLLIPLLALPLLALLANKNDEINNQITPIELMPAVAKSHIFYNVDEIVYVKLKEARSAQYLWEEVDQKDYSSYITIKEIEPMLYELKALAKFSDKFFKFEIHNYEYTQSYLLNVSYKPIDTNGLTLDTSEVIF